MMKTIDLIKIGTALLLGGLIIGCGNSNLRRGRSLLKQNQYAEAIARLEAAERDSPENWLIKRELGIAYYRNAQNDKAIEKLIQTIKIRPRNGRSLLYLGLCYEQQEKYAEAVSVYRVYNQLSVLDPLRKELQARIRDVHLKELQKEVKQNLSAVEAERIQPPEPNTMAILYFRNLSQTEELTPLLKGIAEILTTDFGKVQSLRLVERIKLQILLDEMQLSTSEFFDQVQSPKAGRLLGASQLISGGIERLSATSLQINAGAIITATGELRGDGAQATGALSEVLALEKVLFFDLIKDLGVKLSEAEIETIKPLPTKNVIAFVAFCKGLDFEDKNQLDEAIAQYNRAVQLDPAFALARQKREQISIQRLSLATIEKLSDYQERLSGTEPTLLDTGSKIGLRLGLDNQELSPFDPNTFRATGVITITGDLPRN
jgi:tetratricopeptide (TPR) repeat protein